jgi:hypothetical protein
LSDPVLPAKNLCFVSRQFFCTKFLDPDLDSSHQGCQTKNHIWVNFLGSCNGRCWYVLWTFDVFYGHLVYFVVIWYILPRFGMLNREKSGNPASHSYSDLWEWFITVYNKYARVSLWVGLKERLRCILNRGGIIQLQPTLWHIQTRPRGTHSIKSYKCILQILHMWDPFD